MARRPRLQIRSLGLGTMQVPWPSSSHAAGAGMGEATRMISFRFFNETDGAVHQNVKAYFAHLALLLIDRRFYRSPGSTLSCFEPQLLIHRLSVVIGLLGANLVPLHLSEARARHRKWATPRGAG